MPPKRKMKTRKRGGKKIKYRKYKNKDPKKTLGVVEYKRILNLISQLQLQRKKLLISGVQIVMSKTVIKRAHIKKHRIKVPEVKKRVQWSKEKCVKLIKERRVHRVTHIMIKTRIVRYRKEFKMLTNLSDRLELMFDNKLKRKQRTSILLKKNLS